MVMAYIYKYNNIMSIENFFLRVYIKKDLQPIKILIYLTIKFFVFNKFNFNLFRTTHCFITQNTNSVYSYFMLSRHMIKLLGNEGLIYGLRKF